MLGDGSCAVVTVDGWLVPSFVGWFPPLLPCFYNYHFLIVVQVFPSWKDPA
jgi:hypothetical protein